MDECGSAWRTFSGAAGNRIKLIRGVKYVTFTASRQEQKYVRLDLCFGGGQLVTRDNDALPVLFFFLKMKRLPAVSFVLL